MMPLPVDNVASRDLSALVEALTAETEYVLGEAHFEAVLEKALQTIQAGRCLDLSQVPGNFLNHHPSKIQGIIDFEKLRKEMRGWGLHMDDPAAVNFVSPAYSPGCAECQTALVLVCPGQDEWKQMRPAALTTGKNLLAALRIWHARKPKHFQSPERDFYPIINIWPHVEYKIATGRSEPESGEITRPRYAKRIRLLIEGYETLVLLGMSQSLTESISSGAFNIYTGHHPGRRKMNNSYGKGKTEEKRQSLFACNVMDSFREIAVD